MLWLPDAERNHGCKDINQGHVRILITVLYIIAGLHYFKIGHIKLPINKRLNPR